MEFVGEQNNKNSVWNRELTNCAISNSVKRRRSYGEEETRCVAGNLCNLNVCYVMQITRASYVFARPLVYVKPTAKVRVSFVRAHGQIKHT